MLFKKNIFKNKKVLITGHTGFKGSWLTAIFLKLNAKVIGISIDQKKHSHFNYLKLQKRIKHYNADICNYKKIEKIINSNRPDFIFHLAAQSLVKRSLKNPIFTWKTNVIGTINIIEIVRKIENIKKNKCILVIITSDKCYKNLEKKSGYKENDILGGDDPYSASKASAEIAINSEINSFVKTSPSIRIASARAGNVIGGGDWSENRIIPDIFRSIKSKRKLLIRNPRSTRPWQHVLEPLCGYIKLAYALKNDKKFHGESFNFGPSNFSNKTVLNLVKEISSDFANFKWKILKRKKTFKETGILRLNSFKAKKYLKWQTKLSFKETMRLTSEWYRSFFNEGKKIKTFEQIENYLKKYIYR